MHALPVPGPLTSPEVDAPAAERTTPGAVTAPGELAPWLYRSEGFAEDLDSDPAHEPRPEPPLVRWGLPLVALVGVVGLAAAFSLA